MSRLTPENEAIAREIISRYPKPKSALIPLLHLSQEQNGHVTDEAMVHLAELVDVTPAEVIGTCTFYEMFKREPVGRYVVNICSVRRSCCTTPSTGSASRRATPHRTVCSPSRTSSASRRAPRRPV